MNKVDNLAARLALGTADLMKKIGSGVITIEQFEWFVGLSCSEISRLAGKEVDERFKKLLDIEITVPDDWDPDGALERTKKEFCYLNGNINEGNFPASALEPGEKYIIHFWLIMKNISIPQGLDFIRLRGENFLCAKDAGVVKNRLEESPVLLEEITGKPLVLLNEEEKLWAGSGGWVGVPCLYRHGVGAWNLLLISFDDVWYPGGCLVSSSAV